MLPPCRIAIENSCVSLDNGETSFYENNLEKDMTPKDILSKQDLHCFALHAHNQESTPHPTGRTSQRVYSPIAIVPSIKLTDLFT
jgi:hypothetical protein